MIKNPGMGDIQSEQLTSASMVSFGASYPNADIRGLEKLCCFSTSEEYFTFGKNSLLTY